eukprot:403338958
MQSNQKTGQASDKVHIGSRLKQHDPRPQNQKPQNRGNVSQSPITNPALEREYFEYLKDLKRDYSTDNTNRHPHQHGQPQQTQQENHAQQQVSTALPSVKTQINVQDQQHQMMYHQYYQPINHLSQHKQSQSQYYHPYYPQTLENAQHQQLNQLPPPDQVKQFIGPAPQDQPQNKLQPQKQNMDVNQPQTSHNVQSQPQQPPHAQQPKVYDQNLNQLQQNHHAQTQKDNLYQMPPPSYNQHGYQIQDPYPSMKDQLKMNQLLNESSMKDEQSKNLIEFKLVDDGKQVHQQLDIFQEKPQDSKKLQKDIAFSNCDSNLFPDKPLTKSSSSLNEKYFQKMREMKPIQPLKDQVKRNSNMLTSSEVFDYSPTSNYRRKHAKNQNFNDRYFENRHPFQNQKYVDYDSSKEDFSVKNWKEQGFDSQTHSESINEVNQTAKFKDSSDKQLKKKLQEFDIERSRSSGSQLYQFMISKETKLIYLICLILFVYLSVIHSIWWLVGKYHNLSSNFHTNQFDFGNKDVYDEILAQLLKSGVCNVINQPSNLPYSPDVTIVLKDEQRCFCLPLNDKYA